MARFPKFIGLLSAVAALFGCDEGPSSNVSFTSTPDVWSFVTATAAGGPLLVEVRGNPFGGAGDAVARAVTRAVAATFTEPWLRFTGSAADAASTEFRLIWLLDPQPGFNADLTCAGEFPAPDAGRRVMEIRAIFCHRGRPLSAVHGWMRRPATVDDPKWRGLISQMSRQLLSGRG
jgi:hypothetical protein